MEVQGRKGRRRPKRRWLNTVRDDQISKTMDCRGKYKAELHGSVGLCGHTSTPHNIETNTKETKTSDIFCGNMKMEKTSHIIYGDSQYIGDDADAPQIGGRRDGFVGRHLG